MVEQDRSTNGACILHINAGTTGKVIEDEHTLFKILILTDKELVFQSKSEDNGETLTYYTKKN